MEKGSSEVLDFVPLVTLINASGLGVLGAFQLKYLREASTFELIVVHVDPLFKEYST